MAPVPFGEPSARQPVVAPAVGPTASPRPLAPTVAEALQSGVLIVISKASQRMDVFKDGAAWLSTPVSTGRPGHRTPAGIFPILEKRRFHRSNIYSNAPMPFMQRLTMRGIAIHAGRLPGYPASHGCIRVPYGVASALFGLTGVGRTTVVIVDAPIRSDVEARQLALAAQSRRAALPPQPGRAGATRLAYGSPHWPTAPRQAVPPATPRSGGGQTIQLAAAPSPQEAEAHWIRLLDRHPDLARLAKAVIPVVVRGQRFYRLRASGPGAFAYCAQRKSAGLDCFRVL